MFDSAWIVQENHHAWFSDALRSLTNEPSTVALLNIDSHDEWGATPTQRLDKLNKLMQTQRTEAPTDHGTQTFTRVSLPSLARECVVHRKKDVKRLERCAQAGTWLLPMAFTTPRVRLFVWVSRWTRLKPADFTALAVAREGQPLKLSPEPGATFPPDFCSLWYHHYSRIEEWPEEDKADAVRVRFVATRPAEAAQVLATLDQEVHPRWIVSIDLDYFSVRDPASEAFQLAESTAVDWKDFTRYVTKQCSLEHLDEVEERLIGFCKLPRDERIAGLDALVAYLQCHIDTEETSTSTSTSTSLLRETLEPLTECYTSTTEARYTRYAIKNLMAYAFLPDHKSTPEEIAELLALLKYTLSALSLAHTESRLVRQILVSRSNEYGHGADDSLIDDLLVLLTDLTNVYPSVSEP